MGSAQTADLMTAITSLDHWLIVLITVAVVLLAVGVHFEVLERVNDHVGHWMVQRRMRVLLVILLILLAHIIEIWIFGAAIYFVHHAEIMGHIQGASEFVWLDAIYLSATTFTTVGYGDLYPIGPIRMLLGTESLAGFVLVTWSASFTYLEMQRDWRQR